MMGIDVLIKIEAVQFAIFIYHIKIEIHHFRIKKSENTEWTWSVFSMYKLNFNCYSHRRNMRVRALLYLYEVCYHCVLRVEDNVSVDVSEARIYPNVLKLHTFKLIPLFSTIPSPFLKLIKVPNQHKAHAQIQLLLL